MKTYEISIVAEGMVNLKVRANSGKEADSIAVERAASIFGNVKTVRFGDMCMYISAEWEDIENSEADSQS